MSTPVAGAWLDARSCEGESEGDYWTLVLWEPEGRTQVAWEESRAEGAEYRALTLARPPRYVGWESGAGGCEVSVGLGGSRAVACPAGAPPPPPGEEERALLP